MRRFLRFQILALSLAACGGPSPGDTSPETRPPWLIELIARQESEPVANPPAYIAQQEYAAGVYYFLPSRCCDVFSELYDAEGALVCNPDGGITGRGSGNCPVLGALVREEAAWPDGRR